LNNPDEQCDFNHAGLLCGNACRENFNLILGSSDVKSAQLYSSPDTICISWSRFGDSLLFLLKLTVANTAWADVLCCCKLSYLLPTGPPHSS